MTGRRKAALGVAAGAAVLLAVAFGVTLAKEPPVTDAELRGPLPSGPPGAGVDYAKYTSPVTFERYMAVEMGPKGWALDRCERFLDGKFLEVGHSSTGRRVFKHWTTADHTTDLAPQVELWVDDLGTVVGGQQHGLNK